jgi:hypothetical protein
MNRPFAALALLAALAPGCAFAANPAPPGPVPTVAPGYILVKPKAGVADATYREAVVAAGGLPVVNAAGGLDNPDMDDLYRVVWVGPGQEEAVAGRLATHPLMEFAQPDRLGAPQAAPEAYAKAADYYDHLGLGTFDAWKLTRGEGQVIAILDSGIDETDPSLAAQIAPGGWNFYFDDADTSSPDHRVGTDPFGQFRSNYDHGTRPESRRSPMGACGVPPDVRRPLRRRRFHAFGARAVPVPRRRNVSVSDDSTPGRQALQGPGGTPARPLGLRGGSGITLAVASLPGFPALL